MDVATTNAVDVAQHEKRSETYHFFTQAGFSALGMIFAAGMLITGKEPSVYLPILTSILFAWLPSPMGSRSGGGGGGGAGGAISNMLGSSMGALNTASTRLASAMKRSMSGGDLLPTHNSNRRRMDVVHTNVHTNPIYGGRSPFAIGRTGQTGLTTDDDNTDTDHRPTATAPATNTAAAPPV